ncbi:armadillo-type protein [Fusarium tricinctum]|uniref:Armadillo-type protein n=1 Tax=Fusarium tricinctum TaxID=61284 RepID=A0A8K0SAK4_9HYPO|nr:armadillo-type protein [Fusarium tricinctum]
MESTTSSQERNEFFQRLKPCCVKISQLAIREGDAPVSSQELGKQTGHLLSLLDEQIKQNPLILDEKFSEYVFFPLHHVFRRMDQYPMSLIENCIKTLTILITHGWKAKISAELVRQILSLLTFIIDGTPGSAPTRARPVAEETVLETFRGLTALFNTAGLSATAAPGLSEAESIPALGHGVTVMLNGVIDGATPQIQQEALRALQAVYYTVKETAALASFLPGTISSLAKVSSSPNRYKGIVLAKCLETVSLVLTSVMADIRTRSIMAKTDTERDEIHDNKILSPAWLKATAMQVKKALSAIMKLRSHDSIVVKNALNKLCVIILDECHNTLSNSTNILVETAMMLGETENKVSLTQTSLQDLVGIYPELGEIVKTTTYNWMSSLTRLMQSGDEDVKRDAIRNVLKGLELLKELHIQSSTLDESMSVMLRDSVISLMQASKALTVNENTDVRLIDGAEASKEYKGVQYQPVILPSESQKKLRSEIASLIAFLGSSSQQARFAGNMLEQVQETGNLVSQVATFWLCFQLVKASHASSAEEEMFLNLTSIADPSQDIDTIFNELYATSVQILDRHTDTEPVDWRLEALALEVTAYTAQRSGESFRPELIDVLFPIATFLGSNSPDLQKHAIVTLNNIAVSCGYPNVSELIIQNVDYMVNSVSLRLNSLDISPASINVLTMMIRLAGPRLVPYLDDVVDSIFGALDNYHGYPIFVENLFAVLKEVVNQGVRSDMLLLEYQTSSKPDHRKEHKEPPGLPDLLDVLKRRKQREVLDEAEKDTVRRHPKIPWKEDKDEGEIDEAAEPPPEPEKPPNTQTYQLLLRVANLTQHYLTSPTPTLRRSLLELLTIASTALAPDEEAFLPLVNSIWPVVIGRLQDPEAYITVEACRALAGLCAAAGDFLSSRFKTDWADWLRDWCRKVKRQASASPNWTRPRGEAGVSWGKESDDSRVLIPLRTGNSLSGKAITPIVASSSGSLGKFASPARVWEGTIELLTALVSYVQVDEEMFDDILDLLSDILERNVQVREALEAVNGDAVWLSRYERGNVERQPTPQMDGVKFTAMATSG